MERNLNQLAHGIKVYEKPLHLYNNNNNNNNYNTDIHNNKLNNIWLFGKYFKRMDDIKQYELYILHFESILWFTYRKSFLPLVPYHYTSDAGWGCMLRSGQMILGETLQRHILVEYPLLNKNKYENTNYNQIIKWFYDINDKNCYFSLQNMVKTGMQYDKLPGEWYGPTTVAQIIRDLVNVYSNQLIKSLVVYVAMEGVLYNNDINKICQKNINICSDIQENEINDNQGILYDPLFNIPTKNQNQTWTSSVLILVPLRLGLDSVNDIYFPALRSFFELPQSVGMIGGKQGHSVYFVASEGELFHLLDPHIVHPAPEFGSSFPSASHLHTVHTSVPLVMEIKNIDPSLALGFYCRNKEDYEDLKIRINQLRSKMECPISIAEMPPDYSFDINDRLNTIDNDNTIHDITMDPNHLTDVEDEYVLI